MPDRVTREDLAQTAPDPGDDFEGFLNVVADQIIAEIERGTAGKTSLERQRWYLERSIERLYDALHQLSYPKVALAMFARSLVHNIGSWSELLEQPDNGGKG